MMNRLSDRINNLSESQTIAMSRRSRELKAAGKDVISLSLGEPDFNPPKHVLEVAKAAIDGDFNHYPPVGGYADLKQAISNKFKVQNGLNYDASQIVVSTGAKQSIANVVLSLINPGDEVIILAPYWVSYMALVQLAGGVPKLVSAGIEQEFKISPDQLSDAISDKTRLIIYSSPSNPTGSSYTKEEMAGLAAVIAENPHVTVLADEIYEHINFVGEHVSMAANESVYNQVVTVNGISKAYAMTGWRIGYIGAPKDIAAACDKMQGQFTSGANSIGQRAAIAALETSISDLKNQCAIFQKRRDLVVSRFSQIDGFETNIPPGAFYLFPKVEKLLGRSHSDGVINDSSDLCMYLLNEVGVAMVPGEAFGAPGYVRMSYATSEEQLNEAADRVAQAISKLS